jgi:hypothetical protein
MRRRALRHRFFLSRLFVCRCALAAYGLARPFAAGFNTVDPMDVCGPAPFAQIGDARVAPRLERSIHASPKRSNVTMRPGGTRLQCAPMQAVSQERRKA